MSVNKFGKVVMYSALALSMVAGPLTTGVTTHAATDSTAAVAKRAGITIAARGSLSVDGSAVEGLTLTDNYSTRGTLGLHWSGQQYGVQINHGTKYTLAVPKALQPLFATEDFAEKYISDATFNSNGDIHNYTDTEIKIAEDGSTIEFDNPDISFFASEKLSIDLTVDLGSAVTDTNVRIADDHDRYQFTGVFTDDTSVIDWDVLAQADTSTIELDTEQLDPGYPLFKAPNVQPVTDAATEVIGVGLPNATVRVQLGDTVLGTAKADISGFYRVTIAKQAANTTLTVIQNAGLGDSQATQVLVTHATVDIAKPVVNQPVKDNDTTVSGTGDTPGNQVVAIGPDGVTEIGRDYVTNQKTWSITFNEGTTLKATDVISFYEVNSSGDKSALTNIAVQSGSVSIPTPTMPKGNPATGDTVVSGKGSNAGNTITIKTTVDGVEKTYTGTVAYDKTWSVEVPALLRLQILNITESDANGNVSPTLQMVTYP